MTKNIFPGSAHAIIDKTKQDFSTKFVGSVMAPNVLLLHSTEGTTWPTYSSGAVAPNMTIKPDFVNKRVLVRQHFPANRSARALENHPGGVETNTLNAFQIELVGTCNPPSHKAWAKTQHIYMPEAPDWFILGVAEVMQWLHAEWDLPILDGAPRGWGAYPASYGASKYRLSFNEWTNSRGVLGHQHVPENVHGDPGAFPIAKLIAAALPKVPTAPAVTKKDGHAVVTSTRLWGRASASPTGLKLFSRAKGFKIHYTTYKDVAGIRWYRTAYGTWYPGSHLKLV